MESTSQTETTNGSSDALVSGIVTVSVKDLSSGGLSTSFEIKINIFEAIQEASVNEEEEDGSSKDDDSDSA